MARALARAAGLPWSSRTSRAVGELRGQGIAAVPAMAALETWRRCCRWRGHVVAGSQLLRGRPDRRQRARAINPAPSSRAFDAEVEHLRARCGVVVMASARDRARASSAVRRLAPAPTGTRGAGGTLPSGRVTTEDLHATISGGSAGDRPHGSGCRRAWRSRGDQPATARLKAADLHRCRASASAQIRGEHGCADHRHRATTAPVRTAGRASRVRDRRRIGAAFPPTHRRRAHRYPAELRRRRSRRGARAFGVTYVCRGARTSRTVGQVVRHERPVSFAEQRASRRRRRSGWRAAGEARLHRRGRNMPSTAASARAEPHHHPQDQRRRGGPSRLDRCAASALVLAGGTVVRGPTA